MQEQKSYEYTVIRLVPCVERAEFLNIGVMIYCREKKYLNLRYHLDKNKINSFSVDLDLQFIEMQLKAFGYICAGKKEGGLLAQEPINYRFRWLAANRSTIIQCSKVHTGLSKDPEKTLNDLLQKMVL